MGQIVTVVPPTWLRSVRKDWVLWGQIKGTVDLITSDDNIVPLELGERLQEPTTRHRLPRLCSYKGTQVQRYRFPITPSDDRYSQWKPPSPSSSSAPDLSS